MIPAATDDDRPLDRAKAYLAYAERQVAEAGGNTDTASAAAIATAYAAVALAERGEA